MKKSINSGKLESEMDEYLGYRKYERSDNPDYRNGKVRDRLLSDHWQALSDSFRRHNESTQTSLLT